MSIAERNSLLIIFAIAAAAPFLCEWIPRIRLPLVVLPETAASLVGAGMVSVLLFPIVALALRRSAARHAGIPVTVEAQHGTVAAEIMEPSVSR